MIKIKYIEVNQPIGNFYLASMEAKSLIKVTRVIHRGEHPDAVQREKSKKRIKEIAGYCSDPDATFPTPIIVAIDPTSEVRIDDKYIYIDESSIVGDILDGQHRIGGLKESGLSEKFQVPVVFMFDLVASQKAYIFSIINSKQTRVNMSLIYDLFALSEDRSPYKTCHEIARALNKEVNSPFYNRLKMLGKKEDNQLLASLSQGTFIKYVLELISKNPDDDTRKIKLKTKLESDSKIPLREYFINENDAVIYKIVYNLFKAVSIVFEKEWNNPDDYILSKSIGFGAMIKIFPHMLEIGKSNSDMSVAFFISQIQKIKKYFDEQEKEISSSSYGSNEQARSNLAKDFLKAIET